jgi:site-specific recombinase XerD
MSGVDLMTVRELLGHKTIEMTLRDAHLAPVHKMRAVNILDQVMSQTPPRKSGRS